ncbi:NADPH-dependent F420 reductase [Sphingomonas xinjiangensis]|uniref:Putative dinucleotide-binding enzyme n=1 Tax=Sphingomonas xinjiangensis TaxID=643568 RepID=A0A840YTD3_9SPHN|nr:NAD(P)-binding domain-containing protein [Sphingomonas xinjiangensis]MBB5712930.1 putative dinucleotide-binding enzyme [Sphingomonas xinjiangensis]
MKIGIVGSGQFGKLWSQAGHQVLFSSRHPQKLAELVEQPGGAARAGTPVESIAFGDVVLLSKPFAALLDFGRSMTEALGRKVLFETANRPTADAVRRSCRGTGPYLREWFSGVPIVRAFNSGWDRTPATEAQALERGAAR